MVALFTGSQQDALGSEIGFADDRVDVRDTLVVDIGPALLDQPPRLPARGNQLGFGHQRGEGDALDQALALGNVLRPIESTAGGPAPTAGPLPPGGADSAEPDREYRLLP